MKKLRAADWLKTSAFFIYYEWEVVTQVQITNGWCAVKILSRLSVLLFSWKLLTSINMFSHANEYL